MPGRVLEGQCLLFDLDGVLVDSRAVVERVWQRWAQRHGIDPSGVVARAHGRRSIDSVRDFAPQLDAEREVEWLEQAELSDTDGLVALPGALDLYRAVPAERRAVVTSGGRALAEMRLRTTGFELPAVLVAADDVREGKPDPGGYLIGAKRLGREAGSAIVIEDAPPGVEAGRRAGATVLAVATTFAATQLVRAHVTVASLEAIRLLVEPECLRLQVEAR
jgi:mannitol-1-/sugar-/sorbitol-6-phosphatase